MKNKKFIILISTVALVIVGLFGFIFYNSLKPGVGGEAPPSLIELIRFGQKNIPSDQPITTEEQTTVQSGIFEQSDYTESAFKFQKISEIPVVGATAFDKERAIEGLRAISFAFSADLKPGGDDQEVRPLQVFLNSITDALDTKAPKVGPIAKTGAGSPGKEGTYFGPATKEALIRFQKKNSLAGDGVFAETTREKVNGLLVTASPDLFAKLVGPQKNTESVTALRYVDSLSGNIYETFVDKLDEKRVS